MVPDTPVTMATNLTRQYCSPQSFENTTSARPYSSTGEPAKAEAVERAHCVDEEEDNENLFPYLLDSDEEEEEEKEEEETASVC